MAKAGDSYIVILSKAHLEWGTHRYTNSRDQIYGEGYIPIPVDKAYNYGLLNSNGTGCTDILGQNIFRCQSRDGLFNGILKAQGCREAGDIYAKQFSADGNLKALGTWYAQIGAKVGDALKVSWISSTDMIIEKL